jgi:hypothetical protein
VSQTNVRKFKHNRKSRDAMEVKERKKEEDLGSKKINA